jgi:hypothetical protein
MVSARIIKTRTVKDGLSGWWLRDCGPNMGAATLMEFLALWYRLGHIVLDPARDDVVTWRWSSDGQFSASSAYAAFFAGLVRAPLSGEIWRSRAPFSCKFFAWLASKDRCWTADRLLRRGLPAPPACPLCDQEPESLRHLLLGCVMAREVWSWALQRWGRPDWLPGSDPDLVRWWASRTCPSEHQRDMWTAIILVFWCIWKHRNDVVFNNAAASSLAIKARVREEFVRWRLANLFRGDVFSFPDPEVMLWQLRE